MSDWQARIAVDPKVMVGKPVIRGTRIPIELIVRMLGQGISEEEILEEYPRLQPEDIRALVVLIQRLTKAMHIKSIEISGYRGFATPQTLFLAQPDGRPGGGITTLVGPNNAGKSSIVEVISLLKQKDPPSFSEGKRNQNADYRVSIKCTMENDSYYELRSILAGGSESLWTNGGNPPERIRAFVLPSRRHFNPFFGRGISPRFHYVDDTVLPSIRGQALDEFSKRLFEIQSKRKEFDDHLGKVLDPLPNWTIELAESGQYYLKFSSGTSSHSSDGLGEGIVSLFFIVDALYDATSEYELVVIDEPELSLHPSLQKKLYSLLQDYAKNHQIVISTHSPYFADFEALVNGATITRVHRHNNGTILSPLSTEPITAISSWLNDKNNPHVLGLDMREIFFLQDSIILVEGQEDVIYYKGILEELNIQLPGEFLGWGVGGAEKMEWMARILFDLGFERVVGVLDANMAELAEGLRKKFPNYLFLVIPADDVRTKKAVKEKPEVKGLVDQGKLRDEYKPAVEAMFQEISAFLIL